MYYIGVDSGGTKTAFALCDDRGNILARHMSGSGGFVSRGPERIETMLREGVDALFARSGITMADVAAAALGFPGYGETEDSAPVLDALCARVFHPVRALCRCDSYLGWAGSLAMEPGINIVAGTGSICYGVNEQGQSASSSGWGAYCDEGSCRWLGSRLIQTFTRQADGRAPRTLLYDMFRRHFGLSEDIYFIGPLNHDLGGSGIKTARLQILLKEICDAGDPCAAELYREAAEELWLAVAAVAAKLGLAGTSYRVSYSGGLFRSGACILDPLRALVEAAGARLVPPRFTPDQGALLLAMHEAAPDRDFTGFAFTELSHR